MSLTQSRRLEECQLCGKALPSIGSSNEPGKAPISCRCGAFDYCSQLHKEQHAKQGHDRYECMRMAKQVQELGVRALHLTSYMQLDHHPPVQALVNHGMMWGASTPCQLLQEVGLHRQGVWGCACPCGPKSRSFSPTSIPPPTTCAGWQLSASNALMLRAACAFVQKDSAWYHWWDDAPVPLLHNWWPSLHPVRTVFIVITNQELCCIRLVHNTTCHTA